MDWTKYRITTFDGLIQADGQPRPAARRVVEYLAGLSSREIAERLVAADVIARVMGITFTVYTDGRNVDRTLPFGLIPRVIALSEWQRTEADLKQRMRALNLFIGDLYGKQQIVKDKVFPAMQLKDSVNFREQCVGIKPPLGIWAHITTLAWLETRTSPTYSSTSYRCENERRLRVHSGWSAPRCSLESVSWVVAGLPADMITSTRSPGYSKTCILRYTRTSSNEALVRVSAAKTRPWSTSIPTQQVMRLPSEVRFDSRRACAAWLPLQGPG